METFNVQTPCYAIIKRKCNCLYNTVSSKNVLYKICQKFAEKKLRVHSSKYG